MAAWAPPLSLVHVQEVTGECSWGQQEGKWAEGTQGCSAVSAKPPENPQELCPGTDLWGCQGGRSGVGITCSPLHSCPGALQQGSPSTGPSAGHRPSGEAVGIWVPITVSTTVPTFLVDWMQRRAQLTLRVEASQGEPTERGFQLNKTCGLPLVMQLLPGQRLVFWASPLPLGRWWPGVGE